MTPQQNINMWFLIFAGQLAADGQYQTLLDLGFKREHIGILQKLRLSDVTGIVGSVTGAVIQAKVDPAAVDILFRIGDRLRTEREVELEFIKAGASQRLMNELFGIDVHQYVLDRDLLGIKGTDSGRRRKIADETASWVWMLWHSDGDKGNDKASEITKYLDTHRATGLSLRDIENIIRDNDTQYNQGHGGTKKEKTIPERRRKETHATC
ncbi:MAG: hypothetical protein DM484_29505 [Candidatus Methylumidiphilus alinenensis]|uniref:DUF2857 domain-containing protein n=1 Tax=Candidatus Methylumidiphilus alinenensis TaxID=2202197 RepID=A0A2W4QBA1_9GAMM|nr:MAG: hypothetical protein DM484_29505 [Candidatus Methylumidiphilus alinenensis]